VTGQRARVADDEPGEGARERGRSVGSQSPPATRVARAA